MLCACRSDAQPPAPPVARRRRPSCSSSSRSTNSRRTCGTNTARTSPAGSRGFGSGAAFRNGYQSHAATETCPGHSTILTGSHPSRTGIIANNWTDQSIARTDKSVYCAEDERVPGSSSSKYKVSPYHLLVPTLGELVKARWPASRSVAVAGKDRAAVMMTGHRVDQRWYWTGRKFETDQAGASDPAGRVEGECGGRSRAGAAWRTARLAPVLSGESASHSRSKAAANRSAAAACARCRRRGGFRASPELDGDTLALAAGLVDEMRLGRGAAPDVLAVSLSATDYVGHTYGTEGQEMCLQLLQLDREIGDFLACSMRAGSIMPWP